MARCPGLTYVWRHLFQRKVRTGLSMLGVAVAGVVALISVSHGLKGSVDRYMEASGASLIVYSGPPHGGPRGPLRSCHGDGPR